MNQPPVGMILSSLIGWNSAFKVCDNHIVTHDDGFNRVTMNVTNITVRNVNKILPWTYTIPSTYTILDMIFAFNSLYLLLENKGRVLLVREELNGKYGTAIDVNLAKEVDAEAGLLYPAMTNEGETIVVYNLNGLHVNYKAESLKEIEKDLDEDLDWYDGLAYYVIKCTYNSDFRYIGIGDTGTLFIKLSNGLRILLSYEALEMYTPIDACISDDIMLHLLCKGKRRPDKVIVKVPIYKNSVNVSCTTYNINDAAEKIIIDRGIGEIQNHIYVLKDSDYNEIQRIEIGD